MRNEYSSTFDISYIFKTRRPAKLKKHNAYKFYIRKYLGHQVHFYYHLFEEIS
jgi:hypothetical protein